MLQEYLRLAKTVDNISRSQASEILNAVLDKLKVETRAIIVDIWTRHPGHGGTDILQPYLRRSDPKVPGPHPIAMTKEQTGLLVWVAENREPVWLDDIPAHAKSGLNRLSGEMIEGRYFNLYDDTRAFVAIPIQYQTQFAILTAETSIPKSLKNYHIDLMKALAEPTGILILKSVVSEVRTKHTEEAIQEFRDSSGGFASTLNPIRTGFIARPFDERFSYIGRAIEEVFRNKHIQVTTYTPVPGSNLVVSEMLSQLNSAHFGIADVTSLNTNVMFETGAMIAVAKPRIILRNRSDNTALPFDLAGYDVYRYSIGQDKIVVSTATAEINLEDFVDSFISDLLIKDSIFRDAKEFVG
jgi:hypothetical protein